MWLEVNHHKWRLTLLSACDILHHSLIQINITCLKTLWQCNRRVGFLMEVKNNHFNYRPEELNQIKYFKCQNTKRLRSFRCQQNGEPLATVIVF